MRLELPKAVHGAAGCRGIPADPGQCGEQLCENIPGKTADGDGGFSPGRWKNRRASYQDDGPGVPDDCLERILKALPPGRCHAKAGEGSGLGQPCPADRAGTWWTDPCGKSDHGLVLVITLPLDKREEMHMEKILIVEDDELIAEAGTGLPGSQRL